MTSDCADQTWLAATSIEPMTSAHLDAVLAIERLSFPSAWSRESYLRELSNPNSCYFVARLEGSVIGHAGMWTLGDEAHISTLAVHPDRRRHGLGRRLLSHLIAVARERGVARITLEVRQANRAAQALYQQSGFEEKGLLPRYYGDTGENGIVMCKLFSSSDDGGRHG